MCLGRGSTYITLPYNICSDIIVLWIFEIRALWPEVRTNQRVTRKSVCFEVRWGFYCIFNRYGDDWWFVNISLYLFLIFIIVFQVCLYSSGGILIFIQGWSLFECLLFEDFLFLYVFRSVRFMWTETSQNDKFKNAPFTRILFFALIYKQE